MDITRDCPVNRNFALHELILMGINVDRRRIENNFLVCRFCAQVELLSAWNERLAASTQIVWQEPVESTDVIASPA